MIEMIVAHDINLGIGFENALPWDNLSKDMAHFKRVTEGHVVVMGRKTFESIGKPLKGRHNVVLSSDPDFHPKGVHVIRNLNELEQYEHYIVIGGAGLYEALLDKVDILHVTEVGMICDKIDTYFPEYEHLFKFVDGTCVVDNDIPLLFGLYKRKK